MKQPTTAILPPPQSEPDGAGIVRDAKSYASELDRHLAHAHVCGYCRRAAGLLLLQGLEPRETHNAAVVRECRESGRLVLDQSFWFTSLPTHKETTEHHAQHGWAPPPAPKREWVDGRKPPTSYAAGTKGNIG